MPISNNYEKHAKTGVIHFQPATYKDDTPHKSQEEDESEEQPNSQVDQDEATPLERCIELRKDIYRESTEVAELECRRMLEHVDPNSKRPYKDVFLSDNANLIAEAMFSWDLAFGERWANARKRQRDWELEKKCQSDKAVEKKMEEIRYDKNGISKYVLESDLRRAAEQQVRLDRYQKKHDYSGKLTVGNVKGKSKEELMGEAKVNRANRMTVGSLYGMTHKEVVDSLQPEFTELERCIKNRMETKGESYDEALKMCKVILEGEFEEV